MPEPQPPPQVVQPQPTPQTYNVQSILDDQGNRIEILAFQGPNGQWVSFLDSNGAKALSHQLLEAASGLVVTGVLPPDARNGNGKN